jgi:hypothetical protein
MWRKDVRTVLRLSIVRGSAVVLAIYAIMAWAGVFEAAQTSGQSSEPVAVHSEIGVTVTTTAGAQHQTMSINGSADFNLGSETSMQMQLESPSLGTLQLVEVNNTLYSRHGSDPWQSQPVNDGASLSQGLGTVGSQAWLNGLRQQGISVQQLADETVDGQPAHHFQIMMTEEQAISLIDSMATLTGETAVPTTALNQALGASSGTSIKIDVWNGISDGFPYQVIFSAQMTFAGKSYSITLTMENTPLSQPVSIQAPATGGSGS